MKHKELKFIAVFISFILVISVLPSPFAKTDVAGAQTQRPAYACATLNEPILSVSCLESSCIQTYDTFAGQLNTYFNGNPPSPLQGQYDNRDQCVAALRTFLTEVQSRNIFTSSGGSSITVDRSKSPLGTSAQTCNDQCFARTSVNSAAAGNIGGSVPIGICSTQELALATSAVSGVGSNVGVGVAGQTFTLGKGLQYGCQVNEWCICQRFGVAFNVNNQQNNQQGTTGLQGFNTASVPGTRGFLLDPADVTDTASKKPANDVVCSEVSRVALEADINPKLVPTGTQLTITGTVTKFSNTCNGAQYECRVQYNAGCHVDQGFFKTCVIPNDCSPDVQIPGGKKGPICTTNWMRIIGIALMVVAVATIVFSAAIAAALSPIFGTVSQGAVALSGLSTAATAGQLIATPTPTPGGGTGTQEGIKYPFLESTSSALDVQRDPGTGEVRSYRDPGTGEVVIIGTNYQGSGGTTQTLSLEKLQEATCAALALDTATTPEAQAQECQRAKTILRTKLEGKDINDQTVVANAISETIGEIAGARTTAIGETTGQAAGARTRPFDVGDRIYFIGKQYERAADGLWREVGSTGGDTLTDQYVENRIQIGAADYWPLPTSPSQQPVNQPPAPRVIIGGLDYGEQIAPSRDLIGDILDSSHTGIPETIKINSDGSTATGLDTGITYAWDDTRGWAKSTSPAPSPLVTFICRLNAPDNHPMKNRRYTDETSCQNDCEANIGVFGWGICEREEVVTSFSPTGLASFGVAYAQDFPDSSSSGAAGDFLDPRDFSLIKPQGESPGTQLGPCPVQQVCPENTVPSQTTKQIDGNNCPIITCKPKTGITSESALKTAGLIGAQVGAAMFAQSTPLPQGGCHSICGKNIGRTPVAASPVCPGYPVASAEKTFRCGEQSCGGFEGKDVSIQIKTQEGRVLNTATVTTDANGAFSYTFTAPSTEAVFIAVVTTEGSTVTTTTGTP